MAQKKHIKNTRNGQPVCGVAIIDASLEFIEEKHSTHREVLGQASTCQRCAQKAIRELNRKGEEK